MTNPHGLHARPAARLVQEARAVRSPASELRNLTTGAGPVPATALSKVATLGVLRGHQVEVRRRGQPGREALDHVLPSRHEGSTSSRPLVEPQPQPVPVTTESGQRPLRCFARDRGRPGLSLRSAEVVIPDEDTADPTTEWRRRARGARRRATGDPRVRATAAREVGESEARIFDAHLLFIDDARPARRRARAGRNRGVRAAGLGRCRSRAWRGRVRRLADPYLRARAADVRARRATGGPRAGRAPRSTASTATGVLVADDLHPGPGRRSRPSPGARHPARLGSPTGHSAILARSRGIPAVVGQVPVCSTSPAGTTVALDGATGEVFVDPSDAVLGDLHERHRRARAKAERALAAADEPAATARRHRRAGGCQPRLRRRRARRRRGRRRRRGLVRTEFLFLGRETAPDVEEQAETYCALAEALDGRRITLRTLDVGGDKPLPYAPQPTEANPFLGVRGIRFALAAARPAA